MRFSTGLTVAAVAGAAVAQSPSLCDKYTTALLKENTGANQLTLLTLLVNTVVIGNYTQPNKNAVPGILAPGTGEFAGVDLLPYFTGKLVSTNAGGTPKAINFLDDGGAEPLKKNMPSNGTNSRQYRLLTHLYQYFGGLLGCSATGFPAYTGSGSQFAVHKYMGLDEKEVTYFITQVGLAAASFGVAPEDITTVATALNSVFNVRCAPPTTVIPSQGAQLQSICIAGTCKLSENATCPAYGQESFPKPAVANSTSGNSTSPSASASSSSSSSAPSSSSSSFPGAASASTFGFGAVVAGLFALML